MDRRALLALVGCGVATGITGRSIARAAPADDAIDPKWIFPAGEYRIGIDSTGDRDARLIVFATGTAPERRFTIPAPPVVRPAHGWFPLHSEPEVVTTDPPTAAYTVAPSPGDPDVVFAAGDTEVRIVYTPQPGVTTYVDCGGIGIGGCAYVAATVLDTGPTYLVRLDPVDGRLSAAAVSARPSNVLALYRRSGQSAIRVAVADGPDVDVHGSYDELASHSK